jgi:hypothetical protein
MTSRLPTVSCGGHTVRMCYQTWVNERKDLLVGRSVAVSHAVTCLVDDKSASPYSPLGHCSVLAFLLNWAFVTICWMVLSITRRLCQSCAG